MQAWRQRMVNATRARLRARTVEMLAADLPSPAIIFAPHPDDETLGCGGTILRMRQQGADVHVVFMTDGSASHAHLMPVEVLMAQRKSEAMAAAAALGVTEDAVHWLGFRDGELFAHLAGAAPPVRSLLAEIQPEAVFIPHRFDPLADHRATVKIVRVVSGQSVRMYEYPVWWWHQFPFTLPMRRRADVMRWVCVSARTFGGLWLARTFNQRVDVSAVLAQKRRALMQHRSQMVAQSDGWATLESVSDGEWLDCFFQPFEWFWQTSENC